MELSLLRNDWDPPPVFGGGFLFSHICHAPRLSVRLGTLSMGSCPRTTLPPPIPICASCVWAIYVAPFPSSCLSRILTSVANLYHALLHAEMKPTLPLKIPPQMK